MTSSGNSETWGYGKPGNLETRKPGSTPGGTEGHARGSIGEPWATAQCLGEHASCGQPPAERTAASAELVNISNDRFDTGILGHRDKCFGELRGGSHIWGSAIRKQLFGNFLWQLGNLRSMCQRPRSQFVSKLQAIAQHAEDLPPHFKLQASIFFLPPPPFNAVAEGIGGNCQSPPRRSV